MSGAAQGVNLNGIGFNSGTIGITMNNNNISSSSSERVVNGETIIMTNSYIDINTHPHKLTDFNNNIVADNIFDSDAFIFSGIAFSKSLSTFSIKIENVNTEHEKFIITGNATILKNPKKFSACYKRKLELTEDSTMKILDEDFSPTAIILGKNAKVDLLHKGKEFTFINYDQDEIVLNDIRTLAETADCSVKDHTKTLYDNYTLEQIKNIIDSFKKTLDVSTYKEILNLFVGQNTNLFHSFDFPRELIKKGYTNFLNFKLAEKSLEESCILSLLPTELKYHISSYLEDKVNIIGNENEA